MAQMNPRQELESIIEFKGGSGLNKGERIDKFFQNHGGKLAIAAGIAAGAGLKIAVGNHRKKQSKWARTAGDNDYLDLTHNLVVDKHGAMLPKSHPLVVGGNIHQLSAREQLDRIINFDMASTIADKLGKAAWDKIGGAALKWGGTGAIAGAATGGITGAMDGDPIGGAMHGAIGGAVLGAGGAAMNKAGAFDHILGTAEERAAKAVARKAALAAEVKTAGSAAGKPAPAAAQAASPKVSAYEGMPEDALTPQVNNPLKVLTGRKPIQKREPVLGGYNVPSKTVNAPVGVSPPHGKTFPMPQAQGSFPIDDPKRRIAASARDALDSIIQLSKKDGDYKRHWSQKKKPKGKPLSKKQQAEEDEQHQMSAREQLEQIINFGIFSLGTAKRVFRGLAEGAEKSPLIRPGAIGMGPSFIARSTPSEAIGAAAEMYGSPKIMAGATIVPKLSVTAKADMMAKLPQAHQKAISGIMNDPVAVAAHERGHAYDPLIEARQGNQMRRADSFAQAMEHETGGTQKRIGKNLAAGMLQHEEVANRRVLGQVQKHGTGDEVDAWKKYANNQMKVGYRKPMFDEATQGQSLTQKKDFLRDNPYLRRQATALEARSGALFFNTSNSAGRSNRLSAREELEVIQFGRDDDQGRHWGRGATIGGALAAGYGAIDNPRWAKAMTGEALDKVATEKGLTGIAGRATKTMAAGGLRGRAIGGALLLPAGLATGAMMGGFFKKKPSETQLSAWPNAKVFRVSTDDLSARDHLNTITLRDKDGFAETVIAGAVTFGKQPSPRAHLNAIISFGVDANGKLHNSKGEFGGDNDAVAHPDAMRATYQRAAGLGATAGAAGVAGGMGMKALVEKLKGLKRK